MHAFLVSNVILAIEIKIVFLANHELVDTSAYSRLVLADAYNDEIHPTPTVH